MSGRFSSRLQEKAQPGTKNHIWAAFPGPFATASLHNRRLGMTFDPSGTLYLTQEQAVLRVTHSP